MEKNKRYLITGKIFASYIENPRDPEFNFEYMWKHLVCGGVSGMVSKASLAPLDRVKILLQTHHHSYETSGIVSGFFHVIKTEGFLALYKGNGAQMITIFPYSALEFTCFEIYQQLLAGKIGGQSHIDKFLAGAGAASTAIILTYPLDTIRSRLAFQVVGERLYRGIFHVAQSIYMKENGLRGFYWGLLPTLMSKVPQDALSFYCFEYLKFACGRYLPKQSTYGACDDGTEAGVVLSIPAKMVCGGFAGAAVQSVIYPLEVTRRMMQVSMMSPDATNLGHEGMISSFKRVYREHGLGKGLYRGVTLNLLRAVPMVTVSFTTFEIMKQVLGLNVYRP